MLRLAVTQRMVCALCSYLHISCDTQFCLTTQRELDLLFLLSVLYCKQILVKPNAARDVTAAAEVTHRVGCDAAAVAKFTCMLYRGKQSW